MTRVTPGQSALFASPSAPQHDDVRIIVGDAADVLPTLTGADMVHADSPWLYTNAGVEGAASGQYDLAGDAMIARHVAMLHACATADAYLLCWCTWPKLGEWMAVSADGPWRYTTGGAWGKRGPTGDGGRLGIGFHIRGDSEPLLIYTKGKPKAREAVSNLHNSHRAEHSEKPVGWLRDLVRAYSPPGGLVVDLYAGRAPLGVACVLEGRRYVGVEIDPERAEIGRANIAAAVARRARGEA